MGEFLSVTAFQTRDVETLCAAVAQYFSDNGHPAQRVELTGPQDVSPDDTVVHDPVGNWTVVTWPTYMQDGPAVEAITGTLGVTASSICVYDGDYWVHRLVEHGHTLDRFASVPDYFAEDPDSEETARLAAEWAGHPDIVAASLGATAADIAPYFMQSPSFDYDDEETYESDEEWGKAFPDDEFDRADVWVFTDFWRRIGIPYPDPNSAEGAKAFARVLRLPPDAVLKLPAGTDEF